MCVLPHCYDDARIDRFVGCVCFSTDLENIVFVWAASLLGTCFIYLPTLPSDFVFFILPVDFFFVISALFFLSYLDRCSQSLLHVCCTCHLLCLFFFQRCGSVFLSNPPVESVECNASLFFPRYRVAGAAISLARQR